MWSVVIQTALATIRVAFASGRDANAFYDAAAKAENVYDLTLYEPDGKRALQLG